MSARLRRWYEERDLSLPWFAKREAQEPDHRNLFDGGNSREVLRRLLEDDPFDLGKLAPLVASDEAKLVHLDRFTARLAAQVAFRGALGRPVGMRLIQWLRSQANQSLSDLLEEDEEDEYQRVPMDAATLADFTTLLPPETGIEPYLTRRATIIFNRFPLRDRVPFYRLTIEGLELETVARDLGEAEQKISSRIQRVTKGLVMQVNSSRNKRDRR